MANNNENASSLGSKLEELTDLIKGICNEAEATRKTPTRNCTS